MDQPLWDQVGQPLNRRHEPRMAVGSVLPVQLRFLPNGQPPGAWMTADILDISHGGMALLVPCLETTLVGEPLLLDVSQHPGFGAVRLPAVLRWSCPAGELGLLQLIGVQLDQPLPRVPPLVQSRK
ncbi:PilZ domain-containing protein [Synechococcus sp. CB0101]|uniref:PilZ domain-containing protein n=1 Tax=Synechococcus sp. CB0101 TaxID=232348 RepID=UPI0002E69B2B|nr:PilZ domain-containing protein [Synechococcus sp. CB0101]